MDEDERKKIKREQKTQTALSFGTTLLGAFLGQKTPSAPNSLTDPSSDKVRQQKQISTLIMSVLPLGALIVAFLTNPSHEQHKAAIRDKVAAVSPIASAFGAGRIAAWDTSYHSVGGVCSYTMRDRQLVSIGVFGIVHVRD